MTQHQSALNLVQLIALTLPAVALYMNVLTEIHMIVARKTGIKVDPDSDHLTGKGGEVEWKPDPYTARFTTAINQIDFALALLSLGILLISGILLILFVAFSDNTLLSVGTGALITGFVALFFSVGATFTISVRNILNERSGNN